MFLSVITLLFTVGLIYLQLFQNKAKLHPMFKIIGSRLIGVKTMGEPSSGWPKGGCSRLTEVAANRGFIIYSIILTIYSFKTLITGWVRGGGRLIGV